MDNVLPHRQSYIPGQLAVKRIEGATYSGRFVLEGNFAVADHCLSDHFQLIYEALEIAANSNDQFASQFRAMCNELMALSADWDY